MARFTVKTFGHRLQIVIVAVLIAQSALFVHQSANAQAPTVTPTKTPASGNSSIGDRVWSDSNRNGLQDAGEPGIANVTVTLLKDCGGNIVVATTTTNANGIYTFVNPRFGQYRVQMSLPTGFAFSLQNQGANDTLDSDVNLGTGISDCITLTTGQNDLTWDAGLYPATAPTPTTTPVPPTPTITPTPSNSSIGDRVWSDSNRNGLQDAGEPGIANVTVTLLKDCGGNIVVATTTTNANGIYTFVNPRFGQYRVQMSLPTGFAFSLQNQGANDTLDSDVNLGTGISDCITLTTGQNDLTWDAGLYPATAPTPTTTPVPPTPTKTPALPTSTATSTNTPVPPTVTATSTDTSAPPTATSTNTLAPPTATSTNTSAPPTATPTNTLTPPTAAPTPTNTPVASTATSTNTLAPTATAIPTNTLAPPTATTTPTNTLAPPTATATPTNTLAPPTATTTPTNTLAPPTATATPTNTLVPPTATATPTNTLGPPTATTTITPVARLLGQATVLSGPNICSNQECYNLAVNCGQVSQPINVSLKVGAPTGGVSERGTIIFFTGWIGDYYWAYDGAVQVARAANSNVAASPDTLRRTLDNNSIIIDDLRAAGFRTVQVEWNSGWFIAQQGQTNEDLAKLACRPATVARWVYDNLRSNTGEAFCATGHSNGASELAYMMTQYHMADLLSLVVFEGGPNWARVDKSCVLDPAHPELYGDSGERNTIDWGFGYANDGSGICSQGKVSQISRFQNASLAFNSWFYVYPHTQVAFLIGANDPTTTAKHGAYFYNWLVSAGTPLITYETVPGAQHFTTEVQAGADMMRNKLLNECRIR